MKQFFTRHLSIIAFTFAIIIILVADSSIYISFRSLIDNNHKVSRTIEKQHTLDHILTHLNELETGPRGYIITGEEHFLAPYFSALAPDGIKQHLRELHYFYAGDTGQQRYLTLLDSLVAKKVLFMQTLVALRKERGFEAARSMVATDVDNTIMVEIRRVIETMKQREDGLLEQRSSLASASMQNTVGSIMAGNTLSLLLLLLAFVMVNREVGARKRESEKLQQLNIELDQRVARRTQALRDSNEKLRVSEEHFRMMVDGVKEYAIFMLDPQGVVLSWNNGAELLKGYREDEIIGQHMSIFYTDDDKKAGKPARLLQRAVAEGRVEDTGWRVRKDCTRFIADVLITPLYDGEHQLKGFTKVTRDITARTENELKIRRLSRMYATLGQINETIVRVKERDELFKTICRVAVEYGKFGLVWIGPYNHVTGLVTPAFVDSKEQGSFPLEAMNIREASRKQGIIARAVATGNVELCKNIQTDTAMQECCQEACSLGFHSAASVPIQQNGVIVAVLNLYSEEAELFDQEELHLLEELGSDISFALETMELETRQKENEAALKSSELQFREMFEGNSAIMFMYDPDTLIFFDANRSAVDFYGWTKEELCHMNLKDINARSPEEVKKDVEGVIAGKKNHFIVAHRRADKSVRDVEVYPTRIVVNGKSIMYSIVHDVTERVRLERTSAFRLSIFDMAPLKTVNELLQVIIDEAERLTGSSIGFLHFVDDNQRTLTMQGWSTNTITNMCKAEAKSGHYALNEAGIWADALRHRSAVIHNDYGAYKYRRGVPAGHAELQREAVVPVFRNDKVVALIGVGNKPIDYNEDDIIMVGQLGNAAWDVIAKKMADDEHRILQLQQYVIENLAMHDSLTGLPNRRLLSDRISLAIAQCRRNKTTAALFIFDLDRFKIVNDTMGHQIGDLLLKEVATRTLGVLRRSGESLARLGGDEYVVLLPQIAALPDAIAIADKIRQAMLQPFDIEGHTINITCSIGIALCPEHGEDEQTLMKHADAAMYQAKNEGRNRITVSGDHNA
ncbi:MAG: GAF domain-containing protein [Chlorobiaceae bacterium]